MSDYAHIREATPEHVQRVRATLVERARVAKATWDARDKRNSRGGEWGLGSTYAAEWVAAATALAAFVVATEGLD